MAWQLPFVPDDPSNLPRTPKNFEELLFSNPLTWGWYTASADYVTTTTQNSVARATTWRDRGPYARHLSAVFGSSFIWNTSGGVSDRPYLRSNSSSIGYALPGTGFPDELWPTTDHSKIFLIRAVTPSSNRFLQGATGTGQHRVYLSSLDRVIAEVGATQKILTRDPTRPTLIIESWDATARSLGLLVNTLSFDSPDIDLTVTCGTTLPTIGANTGLVTGAVADYQEVGFIGAALAKDDQATLLNVVLAYMESEYPEVQLGA